MALTITDIAEGQIGWDEGNDVQSFTTPSVTPGTNCLLVLLFGTATNNTDPWNGANPVVTSSGSGPSWTEIGNGGVCASTHQCNTVGLYATIGGSDPGSFTVSAAWLGDTGGAVGGIHAYTLFKVTGHDTTTPIGGFVFTKEQAGNGANTITLSAAPATDDATLALSLADENTNSQGATFGTGTWTETGNGSSPASGMKVAWNAGYRTASTSTSVPWSDVNTGSDNWSSAQCAVVVKADTSGGGITGTVAETLDAFTSTASGTVEPLPYVVTSNVAALAASDDPTVTFTGYTPALDDLVILFPSSTTTIAVQANASLPAGWVNPLGDGVEVNSDSHGIACLYHLVTSGEVSAVTTTYTATNALSAAITGRTHGVVVRNVNAASPIDNFGTTFSSTNTATPHVLAAITGTGNALDDDSLVVSSVAADGTGTYTGPANWTQLQTAGTTQGRWTGFRDALTTANTNVTATNITPSAGDEYASISVAVAAIPNRTGTSTATMAAFTSSASGDTTNPPVEGSGSPTLGAFTSTASGDNTPPPISGTVAVTLASFTSTATASQGLWPTSISGRKILDQTGGVYHLKIFSSWGMGQNLTTAEITTALEEMAAAGFNAVNACPMGVNVKPDWVQFENIGGDPYFTGTAFQSSLGSAWATYDHVMDESLRLGLTVLVSMFVSFFDTGIAPDINAATNAQMRTFGQNLAARYGDYPNLMWHLMLDDSFDAGGSNGRRLDWYFRGIKETESIPHLILVEPGGVGEGPMGMNRTTYDQFISQEGTDPTGYEWLHVDINSLYGNHASSVEFIDTVYNESGATSYPVWDCEPPYYDNPTGWSGNFNQQARERIYSLWLRGGIGINIGHEGWWPFGKEGWYTSVDWTDVFPSTEMDEVSIAWAFIDEWCSEASFGPIDTFIDNGATGLGSGDTKAAQGASGAVAIAYFPSSRTITVDTTILSGSGTVALEWFDPTDGSTTLIASSEAQQTGRSVTHPGNNSAGLGDWILLVFSDERTGDVAETLGPFTSTASGSVSSPSFTGTVAETLDPFTSTASGKQGETGSLAETLNPFTSTASGQVGQVGSLAETLNPFTSSASGTVNVPGFAGNGAVTLSPFVSTASGSFTAPAITGTVAVTLGPFIANGQEGESTNITVTVGVPTFSSRTASVATVTRSATHAMHTRTAGVPDGADRSASHTMVARDAGDPDTRDRSATIATAHGNPDPPTF